ncbi:MAG: acyl-CoA thioesterase [Slackia sp.]
MLRPTGWGSYTMQTTLVWFEIARSEFLEKLDFLMKTWRRPATCLPSRMYSFHGMLLTYGDTAIVRTRVTKLTPAKTVYSYEVYKEGQVVGVDKPCCTGSSTHCLVSAESFKPVNQKRIMPDLYAAYQEALEADE